MTDNIYGHSSPYVERFDSDLLWSPPPSRLSQTSFSPANAVGLKRAVSFRTLRDHPQSTTETTRAGSLMVFDHHRATEDGSGISDELLDDSPEARRYRSHVQRFSFNRPRSGLSHVTFSHRPSMQIDTKEYCAKANGCTELLHDATATSVPMPGALIPDSRISSPDPEECLYCPHTVSIPVLEDHALLARRRPRLSSLPFHFDTQTKSLPYCTSSSTRCSSSSVLTSQSTLTMEPKETSEKYLLSRDKDNATHIVHKSSEAYESDGASEYIDHSVLSPAMNKSDGGHIASSNPRQSLDEESNAGSDPAFHDARSSVSRLSFMSSSDYGDNMVGSYISDEGHQNQYVPPPTLQDREDSPRLTSVTIASLSDFGDYDSSSRNSRSWATGGLPDSAEVMAQSQDDFDDSQVEFNQSEGEFDRHTVNTVMCSASDHDQDQLSLDDQTDSETNTLRPVRTRRRKNLQALFGANFHMNKLQSDIMMEGRLTTATAAIKGPLRTTWTSLTNKISHSTPKLTNHKHKKTAPIEGHVSGSSKSFDIQSKFDSLQPRNGKLWRKKSFASENFV